MKFYVCFDIETGVIQKLINYEDDSLHKIEVDRDTYVDFIKGKRKPSLHLVLPDSDGKTYKLVAKGLDVLDFDVDLSIHKISKSLDDESVDVFKISQDIKESVWIVSISKDLRDFIGQANYYKDKLQLMYVTNENDPNILLDTLMIPIGDLLKNDQIEIKKESATFQNCSLYCGKIFKNYHHEVING